MAITHHDESLSPTGALEIVLTLDPEDGFVPTDFEITITETGEVFITRYRDGKEIGSTSLHLREVY